MNIFKFSLSSFFVLLSLFSFQLAGAATAPVVTKNNSADNLGVIVANVNIKNAKIVFQDGKNFKISFTISNGEGLQTGVKYGLKLFSDDKSQSLVDEKIYDDSLTLGENSSVSKEITYTPPSILDGSYTILLESKNQSNFPFSSFIVGKIKLTASVKWLEIIPESCYTQIQEDKTNKHHLITEIVEINETDSLSLNCTVINNSTNTVTATPIFNTRYSGSYGEYAPQSGGSEDAITFAKGEKKNISMLLPRGDIPKPYNVKVNLMDGENYSNTISVGYIIKGMSATIQKVSLDKDFYKAGENAEVSFVWFGAGFYEKTPKVTVNASLTNSRGWQCASSVTQDVVKEKNEPVNKISIPIKNTCDDPHIKISISDAGGTVLDQKEFTFKTNKAKNKTTSIVNNKYVIGSIIVFVLIAIFGLYMNRKKKINSVKM
jgi:hypothetical protein